MKKTLLFVSSIAIALSLGSITASAASIKEVEGNNTISESQQIQRNNINVSTVITGKYDGQVAVNGSISDTSDVDYYKVYLPADSSTIFAMNSMSLSGLAKIEILDENLNIISAFTHNQDTSKLGATPYKVRIPSNGNYYVKIYSTIKGGDYIFTIGGPNYTVDDYTYKSSSKLTITPTEKTDEMSFDLSRVTAIPDGAIVYELNLGGKKDKRAQSETRSIKLSSDWSWTKTSNYTYDAKFPITSKKLLKSRWDVKLQGDVSKSNKYYSLTPEIRFNYVYPELPR